MVLDDGRWRVANRGKAIDEYYLRAKLKGYVTPPGKKGEGPEMPPRQWRPLRSPTMKWGYHELHSGTLSCATSGKDCPRRQPPEPADDEKDESSGHPSSSSAPFSSAASAQDGVSPDISKAYTNDADGDAADKPSASNPRPVPDADGPSAASPSAAQGQDTELSHENANCADAADQRGILRERDKEEGEGDVTHFPRGPVGRKARRE